MEERTFYLILGMEVFITRSKVTELNQFCLISIASELQNLSSLGKVTQNYILGKLEKNQKTSQGILTQVWTH